MTIKEQSKNFLIGDNAFDLIRYWAAFSVMLLHYTGYALKLSSFGFNFMNVLRSIVSFFPGVIVLFAISGFLISASYERSSSRKEFFIKRVIRMYPELWVCTIVNLIVVLILANGLLDKSILIWLATQIFGIANTPSCLNHFATGSINGALWTIFTEVQLYIVLGASYRWLKKLSTKKWIVLLIFLLFSNLAADFISENLGGTSAKMIERFFLTYAIWFFIGVFCYLKREQLIPILKKVFPFFLICYAVAAIVRDKIPGYYDNIVISILLPLIVCGAGYWLPKIRIKCDISYEIFLYHWIVLNIIVHFDLLNLWFWPITLIFYIAVTIILAWLSWKYVGKGRN